jgi:hypothetical protein
VFAAGISIYALRQQQAAIQAEAVHRVGEILDNVERDLFTQIELLKTLTQSPLLDGETPNLALFHELATRFQKQLPLRHRIVLADLDRRQIVNTGVPFGG